MKRISPVKPRIKAEKAYEQAIKVDILQPLLSKVLSRLETVPKLNMAWRNAIETEFESVMGAGLIGEGVAQEAIDRLRTYHKKRMIESFNAALGVDITAMMSDLRIRPIMEMAIEENVKLITKIPKDMLSKMMLKFQKTFEEGFDQQKLLSIINKEFKIGGNRAKLIARDQTSKTISALTEARAQSIGIEEYIWITMDDLSVVGTPGGEFPVGNIMHMDHFSRNGVRFRFDNPPPDGHPGQAINCRCVMQMVIN